MATIPFWYHGQKRKYKATVGLPVVSTVIINGTDLPQIHMKSSRGVWAIEKICHFGMGHNLHRLWTAMD